MLHNTSHGYWSAEYGWGGAAPRRPWCGTPWVPLPRFLYTICTFFRRNAYKPFTFFYSFDI